jgi:dienelactone hydrolase
MNRFIRLVLPAAAISLCLSAAAWPEERPPAPKLKEEMRMPWQRGDTNFIRQWQVAGAFPCDLARDCLDIPGGEAAASVSDPPQKRADGTPLTWKPQKSWGDLVGFDEASGTKDGAVAYALATVSRAKAGKALFSIGSADGIRVWVNGKLVLTRDGHRSWTPDEDQIEVDLAAGNNTVLVKAMATNTFSLRVLEPGTMLARVAEIGPSIIEQQPEMFTVRTDINAERSAAEPVKVEVLKPGGEVVFTGTGARGALVLVDAKGWPDGPYEARVSTRTLVGLFRVTHLPWYKGDSLVKARALAAEAAKADVSKPEGITLKMLAEMVDDRLGVKLAEAKGNPWPKIHSPLMEYDELMLERAGKAGRLRPNGFVRLAWRDPVDDTPQFSRAYLPSNYDPAKKWPLVIQMHGFNPANPVYWRWWSADSRHGFDSEYSNHQGVIYMEPHGRGNVQYLGLGDNDVMRGIAEARRLFNVDENRIYLTGDSMGGWGTWNVATRHPDVFAAIAPIFGGTDYHAYMSEEDLAKLIPVERFLKETESSWAMADGLLNTPISVHHGDMDQAVDVEYSRYGVKMLQRWGYNIRYHEYPGRVHEQLQVNNPGMSMEWFLQQQRDPNPRHVRIRSVELRHASAFWARVNQAASPMAFMVVDAEVVDRNVIRLDTDNVLDLVLTPSAALVDPEKPVKVVWNGVARDLHANKGELRLASPEYKPAKLEKNARLPGSTFDLTATPFAVVIGTISKDADMQALCREKAQAFIDGWKDNQKFEPRVFKDTEISDADIARYSLILFGGADANRVTAKLESKIPLRISRDAVVVDGKSFKTRDAAVQMLYPNPMNAERYVWVVAGTSATGMYFTDADASRLYYWDYRITDGHIPLFKQAASALQTNVVAGMFDHRWRYSGALAHPGNAKMRTEGRQLHRPDKNLKIDPKLLDSFVGRYQIQYGPVFEVVLEGERFFGRVGPDESDLIPLSETNYYAPKYNVWIFFTRDAAGKVTGLTGYAIDEFEAKRLE